MLKQGDVVVVTVDGEPLGLVLEEFFPYEPANYVTDPCWLATTTGGGAFTPPFVYSLNESGRVERAPIDKLHYIGKWELVGDHDLADPEYGGM
ncbi:MAG TPA: hypothetical protein VFU96_02275 [Acidimicrobiia bacterium]|nr:hypothetical protein [Acidimicrobiia bacterium]